MKFSLLIVAFLGTTSAISLVKPNESDVTFVAGKKEAETVVAKQQSTEAEYGALHAAAIAKDNLDTKTLQEQVWTTCHNGHCLRWTIDQ